MATNPRFPEPSQFKPKGPKLVDRPERPNGAMPGVVLAIVTAILLLAAIFYFMPRGTRAQGTATAQSAAGQQLQISDMTMSVAPTGGSINLDGQLTNGGSTPINGVMAQIGFRLSNGQTATVQSPVQGIAIGRLAKKGEQADTGRVTGDTEDLAKAPIKPGETRPVRITVDDVPADWNHQIPEVRVVATTGTTAQ
jgi:hypothetical protein